MILEMLWYILEAKYMGGMWTILIEVVLLFQVIVLCSGLFTVLFCSLILKEMCAETFALTNFVVSLKTVSRKS